MADDPNILDQAAAATLAEVLAQGNEVDGSITSIISPVGTPQASVSFDASGDVEIRGSEAFEGSEGWGGQATLGKLSAPNDALSVLSATPEPAKSGIGIAAAGSFGALGNVVARGVDDNIPGALVWTALITVGTATPDTTYITPLVLADAGLYAWTGAAYTKIGDFPT